MIFNVGSQYNGVVIGGNGSVVLDSNGNPTLEPTTGTVTASGLATGTLQGDALDMVTIHDQGGTPQMSNPIQIAKGLRNAASLAIDPTTGDLYLADNGIDGNDGGNEAWSTDELGIIPAALIGKQVEDFGFPYSYVKTIDVPGDPVTVVNPTIGIQPTIAFEPLADPVLTTEGSESEGSSGFALSPPDFPAGLDHGVFIGFHGLFSQGGTANDENPMLFADPSTGHYFDFISNNLPNIGHLDEALFNLRLALRRRRLVNGRRLRRCRPGTGDDLPDQGRPGARPCTDRQADDQRRRNADAPGLGDRPGPHPDLQPRRRRTSGADDRPRLRRLHLDPRRDDGCGHLFHHHRRGRRQFAAPDAASTFTVVVLPINQPLTFSPIPAYTVAPGQTLQLGIASHVYNPSQPPPTLVYSLGTGDPAGAIIDPATGLLAWSVPANQHVGTYSFSIVVAAKNVHGPARRRLSRPMSWIAIRRRSRWPA